MSAPGQGCEGGVTLAEPRHSAVHTRRRTDEEPRELPALVARYQHAWNQAAHDTLRSAATQILTPAQVDRLLADPGASRLATALGHAATRGANPTQVLRAAIDLDDLAGVRSTALVLATRIEDHPDLLGIPRNTAPTGPLPWLDPPLVGPPHLEHLPRRPRAQLITV